MNDDMPWVSKNLKILDRQRRREFSKNKKSEKWKKLNSEYKEKLKSEQCSYYRNFVEDLKSSKPILKLRE